ncbi:D-arabinono-1,4-lactone oxidase [Fischerella sp. PCC 9605]|uniref:D-arabinono-1,4-lactone oxidase n=1 Tax=Fischerella sp. PCC 9605 TaxID=1173024 RepID=UPI00047C9330|nr:D-arabinono-1,4-lactone oxidase [Fischerella sp. PCC 9605]
MQQEWINWSGSIRFTPKSIETPENEEMLVDLVRQAVAFKRNLRVVGSSHSCSQVFKTDDILVSLEKFADIESYDATAGTATVNAGMKLHDISQALLKVGLAMENIGDVDYQAIAPAIGTGTHGAGKHLTNLSGQVIGLRMVTGTGEIVECSLEQNPELLRAARVSMGTLGIFTAVKLRLLPAYKLHRQEWCTHIDDCLANLDWLMEENRNFAFYWYPRRDEARIRIWNLPGQGSTDLSFARLDKEWSGWSGEVLPTPQELRYDESEYSLPVEVAPECFKKVRQRVKEKHRQMVGWRILYRPIARDDAYLSNAYERDIVAITLHQNAALPHWEYFTDIESIFQAYDGRPHWGKKHTLKAKDLRSLYPMWNRFQEIRQRLDPNGIFLTRYLRELLVGE